MTDKELFKKMYNHLLIDMKYVALYRINKGYNDDALKRQLNEAINWRWELRQRMTLGGCGVIYPIGYLEGLI